MFSDASKDAYAACVYMRVESKTGVKVQLIQARSRVSPLEKLTIPRLELMSCLIGCRLTESVKKSLNLKDIPTYYWNDSSTALYWIQKDDPWATFVGNRVQEIRSLSKISEWRHVSGLSNPADLPSRGCRVSHLLKSKWWEGPNWLTCASDRWPKSEVQWNPEEVNQERRKAVTSLLVNNGAKPWYVSKFSRIQKIVRVLAWMLRFKFNSTANNLKEVGPLTVVELEEAERKLWRCVQQEYFTPEAAKNLKTLAVFHDEEGIIRMKTNIAMRDEKQDFKCPILLPSNHFVVFSLIQELHLQHCHAGVQTLLSFLREKYWIVRGRKTVRSVITSCVRCKRYASKAMTSIPVSLPKDRVKDADIFEVAGVDLAGPLYIRGGQKSWIVLYTCAVYRAVHFELVTSLSTEAFLQSLRRFIARRGRPAIIYSDNGTNFVGADNLFKQINWKVIETFSSDRRIQWKFNPPSAAWWGGWWERIVRMVKGILRRVLGKASLSYEDLHTLLCDAESIINSRPLTYLSEDFNDLTPISPAVFLHERREVGVPDIDCVDHSSLNRKFRRRQELMEQVRKRFRVEYLGQLVQRGVSKKDVRIIKEGDIVLIGSDNQKRLDWPLGKVLETIPGKDGEIRVVRLKTEKGELVRPVQRIFPLEVTSEDDTVLDLKEERCEEKLVDKEMNSHFKGPPPTPTQVKTQIKVLRTRSGREVKLPVKFVASFSSFFL